MHSKSDLVKDIAALRIQKNDTLLIHSSMKSIGAVDGGADAVLDAFIEYLVLDGGGLLVFPTHTWATVPKDTDTYDPASTPSCVGLLTNLFMKRANTFRSLNPTHSIAAMGRDAEEYVKGEEKFPTPLGRGGCWHRLIERKAKILFIGCPLSKNTFIHGVEEWCGIANRLTPDAVVCKIKLPDGSIIERPTFRHQSPLPDISKNYAKMEPVFFREGAAIEGKFGDARCVLCDAEKIAAITAHCLKKTPDLFLDETPLPR
jgi:Aminoglycoside N3''-acetyltransferase